MLTLFMGFERDEHFIKEKLLRLKSVLEYFGNNLIRLTNAPKTNFDDKEHYPIDFQLFMEEIGVIEISHQNVLILALEEPVTLTEFLKLKESSLYEVFDDDVPENFSEDTTYLDAKVKDVRILANDDNRDLWHFDASVKPYNFMTFEGYEGDFLKTFSELVISRLSYAISTSDLFDCSEELASKALRDYLIEKSISFSVMISTMD